MVPSVSARRDGALAVLCMAAFASAFLWGAGSAVAADRLVFGEGFVETG
jgi:hypothetical protein